MAVSEKTALRHTRWKRQILEIIRQSPNPSKVSIKRETGLSMESALSLVEELLSEGLITAVGKETRESAGRRATVLRINPDGCYFIGIRFSAGGISGVCMNFEHQVVLSNRYELNGCPTAKEVIDQIERCIERLLHQMGEKRSRLRGIGIGAPGIIDLEKGIITRYVHIPDWENVPLRDIIETRFHVPTYLEHGVKSSARCFFKGQDASCLFVQMGRGISMCVAVNGQIWNGASYLSGEVGHMHIEGNDLPCDCGRRGCLETVVAGGALKNAAQKAINEPEFETLRAITGDKPVSLSAICKAADAGCIGCAMLMERAGRAVAQMLSASIMVVNPATVLLKGRLSESKTFISALQEQMSLLCLPEILSASKFTYLPADEEMDAKGAAELPFTRQFGVEESGDAVQQALEASL